MNLHDEAESTRTERDLRVRSEALHYLLIKGGVSNRLYDEALRFGQTAVRRREKAAA